MRPFSVHREQTNLSSYCTPDHFSGQIVCDCRVMRYFLRKKEGLLEQYDFIDYLDIDVVCCKINDFLPENPIG